jgi:hypothetical protein
MVTTASLAAKSHPAHPTAILLLMLEWLWKQALTSHQLLLLQPQQQQG